MQFRLPLAGKGSILEPEKEKPPPPPHNKTLNAKERCVPSYSAAEWVPPAGRSRFFSEHAKPASCSQRPSPRLLPPFCPCSPRAREISRPVYAGNAWRTVPYLTPGSPQIVPDRPIINHNAVKQPPLGAHIGH